VDAPTETRKGLLSRIATWYEGFRYPRLVLASVAVCLYAPWLDVPFFVDDYRAIRVMEEYRAGGRDRLDLYGFFTSADKIAAERKAGYQPWWASDAVRGQLLRPVAEWSLYLDFLLWRRSRIGYHLTSLLVYVLCLWLLLELFRTVQVSERLARWGALLYAVAAGHGFTILFVTARCDLLAVLASLVAMLAGLRFVKGGTAAWVPVSILGCLTAYLSKEAAAPIAVGFVLLWLMVRTGDSPFGRSGGDKRAVAIIGVLLVVTAIWFLTRARAGLVTTATFMLDPIRRPLEYATQAPLRMLSFFIGWPLPINPAMFYLNPADRRPLVIMTFLGVSFAAIILTFLIRRHRTDRCLPLFLGWVLIFLPVLSCTIPDSRLLMLPGFGLACLGAVWLRGDYDRSRWVSRCLRRYFPAVLLIGCTIPASLGAVVLFVEWETKARADMEMMAAEMAQASGTAGPVAFIVAYSMGVQTSWTQDRARFILGPHDTPRFELLCDAWDVDFEVVQEDTLRLRSVGEPFLTTYAQCALPVDTVFQPGKQFRMPEYVISVVATEAGRPIVLDVRFRETVSSPRYFFYHLSIGGRPYRWKPELGQKIRFTKDGRQLAGVKPAASLPASRAR